MGLSRKVHDSGVVVNHGPVYEENAGDRFGRRSSPLALSGPEAWSPRPKIYLLICNRQSAGNSG